MSENADTETPYEVGQAVQYNWDGRWYRGTVVGYRGSNVYIAKRGSVTRVETPPSLVRPDVQHNDGER